MKFAFQQSALPGEDLGECFGHAASAGADGVELAWRSPLDSWPSDGPRAARVVATGARRHGLTVSGLSLECLSDLPVLAAAASDRSETLRLVARGLAFMAEAEIDTLVLPLVGRSRVETDSDLDRAAELLSEAAIHADRLGARVAVRCGLSGGRLQYLIDACDPGEAVRASPDIAEAAVRGLDAGSIVRALGPERIGGVCVRDVIRTPGQPPDYHVRLGRGAVDFAGLRNALSAVGFDGWIVVDTPPGDADGQLAGVNLADARRLLSGVRPAGPEAERLADAVARRPL